LNDNGWQKNDRKRPSLIIALEIQYAITHTLTHAFSLYLRISTHSQSLSHTHTRSQQTLTHKHTHTHAHSLSTYLLSLSTHTHYLARTFLHTTSISLLERVKHSKKRRVCIFLMFKLKLIRDGWSQIIFFFTKDLSLKLKIKQHFSRHDNTLLFICFNLQRKYVQVHDS
jgi:hypothetical protein